VADGETGFLVPPGDPAALVDAIVSLVTSAELRQRLGAASRRRYERLYRVESMVEGVNRYYDKILDRNTAAWRRPATAPLPATTQRPPSPVREDSPPPPPAVSPDPGGRSIRGLPGGLAERLRCPGCGSPVTIEAFTVTASGEVKTGQLRCARDGRVGAIEQFKVDFLVTEPPSTGPGHPLIVPDLGERRVRADDALVVREGAWSSGAAGLLASAGVVGDSLILEAECTDAVVRMWRQPAGGIADVFVDGMPVTSVDLYQEEGSQMLAVPVVVDLPLAPRQLAVRARGDHHPGSLGKGVCVEEFVLFGPAGGNDTFLPPRPINRGNPYSVALERWLETVPAGEPVLEVGGGDRRRVQPGHLNLEFLKFELADAYGDIQAIPFADDTFAATWTQAVFEHVADPFKAAAELVRVTRPGGLVLTEVAFMQPLHAVPYHFFNMTTWGVQALFSSCEILECDWFGDLSSTIEWLVNAVNLPTKVNPTELTEIVERFRRYDALITHDELRPAASVVYLVARKPL
jgi:SAM-dependent methyltransferase